MNRRLLSSTVRLRLGRSPVLLGTRRVRREKRQAKTASVEYEEDEEWDYVYDLLTAEKIVIADDTNAYQLFGDVIFTCPQEDMLEGKPSSRVSMRPRPLQLIYSKSST